MLSDPDYLEELNIVTDELIDQHLNNHTPAVDRESIEQFVLATAERRKKLRFALALKKRATEVKQQSERSKKWPRLYLPIAAVVLLTAGFGIWRGLFYRSDVDKGLVALRSADRDHRPVAGVGT